MSAKLGRSEPAMPFAGRHYFVLGMLMLVGGVVLLLLAP